MRNFGEETTFVIVDIPAEGECLVKHLDTLDLFYLSELVQFGIGDDYELYEI